MSLPVNNKNAGKAGNKMAKPGAQNSKFIVKPGGSKGSGGGKNLSKRVVHGAAD